MEISFYLKKQDGLGMTSRLPKLSNGFLHPYPALIPLYVLLVGIIGACLWGLGLATPPASVLSSVALAGIGLTLVRQKWVQASVFLGLGVGLSMLHLVAPWNSYRKAMLSGDSNAEIEAIVTDRRLLSSPKLAWLNPDKSIRLSVRRIRTDPTGKWHECMGSIELAKPKLPLRYGQTIYATGALVAPSGSDIPHQMNYPLYLRCKGVQHRFHAWEMRVLRPASGVRRLVSALLALREAAVLALLRDVKSRDDQSLLVAMTLGMKSGLEYNRKQQFQESGSIHLFAVSGLHVGILFTILLLGLSICHVPFRLRYILAPLLLLLYVFFTGMAPSALRAWLMLSVWSCARAWRLPTKPLNTILAVAVILLCVNPLSVFQLGFQYSFIMVLSILLAWRIVQQVLACFFLQSKLIPSQAQTSRVRIMRLARTVSTVLAAMLVFWISGLGLTAWYNGLFVPVSILNNLLAGTVAWLVLLCSCVKVILAPLAFASKPLAWLISCLLNPIDIIASVGSAKALCFPIAKPPLPLVLCYYTTWLFCLLGGKWQPLRRRLAMLLVIGTAMLAWNRFAPHGRTTVLTAAGSNIPVICMRTEEPGEAILINTGPKYFEYRLLPYLRGEGIHRIRHVILLAGAPDNCGALQGLAARLPIDSISIIGLNRRKPRKYTRAMERYGTRWRRFDANGMRSSELDVKVKRNGDELTYTIRFKGLEGPIHINLKTTPVTASQLSIDGHEHLIHFSNRDQLRAMSN